MSFLAPAVKAEPPASRPPRVGLFGLFGSGNLGNDGSLEAMLTYLRANHPDAILEVKCPGPRRINRVYGIDAVPLQWYTQYADRAAGRTAVALKVLGKGIDAFRALTWARRHDLVIVPGTGILESTLRLRASGTPYNLFLLCASARLFGTRVALFSVGANASLSRPTRWLFASAARLAYYRSYRDDQSRDAMRHLGIDTSHDEVYPDLVFSLPAPDRTAGDERTVGVCVMAYYGAADDHEPPEDIYGRYVADIKSFVRWLVDTDHVVRLFWGDDVDQVVAQDILDDLRDYRPAADPPPARQASFSSLGQQLQEMALVGTVVATRYHNVLCGLKLGKPTISIGYSAKHDALMADAGLSQFSQSARAIDIDRLKQQFTELEKRSTEIRQALAERNRAKADPLGQHFAVLSSVLLASAGPASNPGPAAPPQAQSGPAVPKMSNVARHIGRAQDVPQVDSATNAPRYEKTFWSQQRPSFSEPHYRLEKSARIVNKLAGPGHCDLLDVGCGPATFRHLLRPNISYYGIDIAVAEPAPNLLEADIRQTPVRFGDRRFDIVIAQGLFEYLGGCQARKFAEIAGLLTDDGMFIVSYTNFGHHKRYIYEAYSNVQSLDDFQHSLAQDFVVRSSFPSCHNWRHGLPVRWLLKAANMHLNSTIPFISPAFAVEYFFVCTPRRPTAPQAGPQSFARAAS